MRPKKELFYAFKLWLISLVIYFILIGFIENASLKDISEDTSESDESVVNLNNAIRSKRKNYGEECLSNGECSVGLKCLYSKCVCPSTYKWSDKYKACVRCSEGWTLFSDRCLYVSNEAFTWKCAENSCESYNSTLLTFESEFIVDEIEKLYDALELPTNEAYSIGARTAYAPGLWSFLNGRPLSTAGWWWLDCFRANNNGARREVVNGCAEMRSDGLNDVKCDNGERKYICESNGKLEFSEVDKIGYGSSYNLQYQAYRKNRPSPVSGIKPGEQGSKCFANYDCNRKLKCISNRCECESGTQWSNETKKCIDCPIDSLVFGDVCFYISNREETWMDAKKMCASLNKRLMVIEDRYIITFLVPFFRKFGLLDNFWIGAFYENNNWQWLDKSKLESYGYWWSKCRDGSSDDNNCAQAAGNSLDIKKCNTKAKFICQSYQ